MMRVARFESQDPTSIATRGAGRNAARAPSATSSPPAAVSASESPASPSSSSRTAEPEKADSRPPPSSSRVRPTRPIAPPRRATAPARRTAEKSRVSSRRGPIAAIAAKAGPPIASSPPAQPSARPTPPTAIAPRSSAASSALVSGPSASDAFTVGCVSPPPVAPGGRGAEAASPLSGVGPAAEVAATANVKAPLMGWASGDATRHATPKRPPSKRGGGCGRKGGAIYALAENRGNGLALRVQDANAGADRFPAAERSTIRSTGASKDSPSAGSVSTRASRQSGHRRGWSSLRRLPDRASASRGGSYRSTAASH